MSRKQLWVLGLGLVIAAPLLFFRLDSVPGLHGDEAWAGLRAAAILDGERPVTGMNAYTGPLYDFLAAAVLRLLGYNVAALRSLTALFTLGTTVLFYRIATRLFDSTFAGVALLSLVSAPFFTGFGRLATENFALNPFLAASAIWLLLRSGEDARRHLSRRATACALVSGICMGLGVWNHAIFLSVPIAVAAAAFRGYGRTLFRMKDTYAAGAGLLIALAPRIVLQAVGGKAMQLDLPADASARYLDDLVLRIADWPTLFIRLAHGDILFQRFAGEVLVGLPNFTGVLVVGGLLVMWLQRRVWPDVPIVLVFSCGLFVSTLLICPGNSDRYFLLLLYLTSLFVAAAFTGLSRTPLGRASSLVVALFVCAQLSRIGLNYFGAQTRSDGRVSAFQLGHQMETSNHFVRTDGLYQQLVLLGATDVLAEFFIGEPLQFYDLDERRFSSVLVEPQPDGRTSAHPDGTYAVFYTGGLRRLSPADFSDSEPVLRDAHFLVMRVHTSRNVRLEGR